MTFSVVPHFLSPEDKKISVAEGKGGQTVCLSPGEKHFSHFFNTRGGQTFLYQGGDKVFTQRGENKYLMLVVVVAMMILMKR